MRIVRFYRFDLISGDPVYIDFTCVPRGDIKHAHAMATLAAQRHNADAYRLFEGALINTAKPISMMHSIRPSKG